MKFAAFALTASAAALAAACTMPAPDEPAAPVRPALSAADSCTAFFAGEALGTGAQSSWVEAADGLPAYCEVTATLHPAEGSNIGVVYRLPEQWNGKLLGIGGGGWAGNVTLMAASEGLTKGYATMQSDGGHASTNVWDNSWAANPAAAEDFAHRAIHEMTVAGKSLAAAYYGQPHEKAYFRGCSTGGRMALMEAQRYPSDYDAIISGAPVYTLQVQTSAILRNMLFAKDGAAFTNDELRMVNDAVLTQCDADDGLVDGVVGAPRQCGWQPAALQCTAGESEGCLNSAQVEALELAYAGIRSSDGEWAMFPMSKGGEADWHFFIATSGGEDRTGGGGLITLWQHILPDADVDFAAFDADGDVQAVRASTFGDLYEADDPDLSAFFAGGGKLILWHGENDPGPSPVGSNDYAAAAIAKAGPAAPGSFRHFLLPGVGHCRGGPGADIVDWIDALDSWESTGTAPEAVVATKDDGSKTRRICAWPGRARYSGEGDANDPANWSCSTD